MTMAGISVTGISRIINGGDLGHGNITGRHSINNVVLLLGIVFFFYLPSKILIVLIDLLKDRRSKVKIKLFTYDLVADPD